MKKFGGPGKKKKCCVSRRCIELSKQSTTLTSSQGLPSLQSFLSQSGRRIQEIKGDGNCFFRSLSYTLFGTEEHHIIVRSILVRFENKNSEVFEQRMTEVNKPSYHEHMLSMLRPDTWATHLEVMAAATYFQRSIYFCEDPPQGDNYCWQVFRPLGPAESFRFPLVSEDADNYSVPTHFEMVYYKNLHYCCIVQESDGSLSTTPPVLSGKNVFISGID